MKPETEPGKTKPFPLPLLCACSSPLSLQTLAKCCGGTGIAAPVSCCLVEGGVPFVERMESCLHCLPFLGTEEERGKDTQSPPNEGGGYLSSSWP